MTCPSKPRHSLFARRNDLRQRRYFPFPVWSALELDLAPKIRAISDDWLRLRAAAGRPPSGSDPVAPHPLAAFYRPPSPSGSSDLRLVRETAAFERGRAPFSSLPAALGEDDFVSFLEMLAAEVTQSPARLRRGPVLTDPDEKGVSVIFPRPGTLPTRLRRLHAWLSARDGPAPFRAMVAMVAVTNAHPFADGNGRVSRVLANLVLNEDGGQDAAYLPLHELGNRPPGNLTLYARDAELHGAWGDLLDLLRAAIVAAHPTSAAPTTRGPQQDPD